VALGRLRHPNIVEVTDSGIDGAEGGLPYIVTELLEGRSLSDFCRDQGPLPLAQALSLLEQIAAAVDAAHEAGVLHRDLKTGNVFVCSESPESPSVKVLDFGLAKLLAGPDKFSDGTSLAGEESPPGLTTTGSLMGTPLYMAPELLRRGKASRASDIYSFGVLAYEILGGKPPFQGTVDEVLAGHLKTLPPPLPLPPGIWRPLRATLQKDPTLRPGTAGEVVRRFRKGLVEASTLATAAGRAGQGTREQGPRVWQRLLFVAAVLLAASPFYLAFVLSERRPAEPPASTASTASTSPGVTLGFNDIEQACGDLSSLPNYLCLVNRGSERITGGSRLVLGEDLAFFTRRTTFPNGFRIDIEGKRNPHDPSYSFRFQAPKGKALIPGPYTGAIAMPGWGSHPGFDVTVGGSSCFPQAGQFRILQILLTGNNKVRRFVADFETSCHGAIGRIAVGERIGLPRGMFGFNDIEQACGDLSSLPNYLCLVNQGNERIAGGSRLVLGEDLASFTRRTDYENGITIFVEQKKSSSRQSPYSYFYLDLGAPEGKALIPGLYTEATWWPYNKGPYPGIDVTFGPDPRRRRDGCYGEGGQFRILEILLTGDNNVRRFVADFESPCNLGMGRIAVGEGKIELHQHGEKPSLPVTRRPAEPSSSTAPKSPGVTLGFNDIEQACGDLSSLPNYLCLVNRGSEPIAGGARRVLDGDLASFTGSTTDRNGITIVIDGNEYYNRFDFYPPKGKALIPGLYTKATQRPEEPYPGIDLSVGSRGVAGRSCERGVPPEAKEERQFRILQILLTGNKVRRFVADFETNCGAIGRIAVGERIKIRRREVPPTPAI